jgi:hypothetical protein
VSERQSPEDEGTLESVERFHIVVGPDGVSRSVDMTETFSDGSSRDVVYEDVAADDPYVQVRQRIAGEEPPSEVATTFAPSPVRPRTYAAGMPFLEGRESHTTESPRGTRSEGVRWRCTDPEVLQRALADVLLSDGWMEAPSSAIPSSLQAAGGHAFKRGRAIRLVNRYDFEGESVIELSHLGEDWFDLH